MVSELEVKPCPFCYSIDIDVGLGEVSSEGNFQYIYCWNCGATGPKGEDKVEAIIKWNYAGEENAG